MITEFIAHSRNKAGVQQGLIDHLEQVAKKASEFAGLFGAQDLAYIVGLWHDLGKFNPEFQNYLHLCETDPMTKRRGPDHKGAGALLANNKGLALLAYIIQGHHGGLKSEADAEIFLREKQQVQSNLEILKKSETLLPPYSTPKGYPEFLQKIEDYEFFIRMLFSCLVDSDSLDTEQHFDGEKSTWREFEANLLEMREQFHRYHCQFVAGKAGLVNDIRREVFDACLEAAEKEPGFFRLSVPTGGGKTLSSLAFALDHASLHDLERIIYAIPFISITEQTTTIFRSIFSEDSRYVLEHHSAVEPKESDLDAEGAEMWGRLAAENWDAPLIVTTTVQLFESLFAARVGASRKNHNLAKSVIILDEAQALPTRFLEPILSVLKQLVHHYGATVVLCTATQPALEERNGFKGINNVRDIIAEPERLFSALKRVSYTIKPLHEPWPWEDVANEIRINKQVLAILNTRNDAFSLLDALRDMEDVYHLSTRMCGEHRKIVLEKIRSLLKAGKPCRLVATQVVEAGVDLDFPLVLRACGPLDSIVQAAGRCNREGRMESGQVIIFRTETDKTPPGAYRTGTDITKSFLSGNDVNFDDPGLYQRYFRNFYNKVPLDDANIQSLRFESLNFPEVQHRFRMIDDNTFSCIVHFHHPEAKTDIDKLLEDVYRSVEQKEGGKPPRYLLRQLQPFMVNLNQGDFQRAEKNGTVAEITPGLWEWKGSYNSVRGIELRSSMEAGNLVW